MSDLVFPLQIIIVTHHVTEHDLFIVFFLLIRRFIILIYPEIRPLFSSSSNISDNRPKKSKGNAGSLSLWRPFFSEPVGGYFPSQFFKISSADLAISQEKSETYLRLKKACALSLG